MIGIRKLRSFYLLALLPCLSPIAGLDAYGQLMKPPSNYSRADSLRGSLSEYRSAYDVLYYELDVKMDIDKKYISGSNLFKFVAKSDFKRLQFDLFNTYTIEKVVYRGQELTFEREYNAVFVDFPKPIEKGNVDSFTVYYAGHPMIAKNPPWDGGFVFSRDVEGKDWVATANQGLGASSWWPNKDHLSDEPDSMLIRVSVPKGLVNVSNGRLRKKTDLKDGYTRYDWFVSQPINNYNISMNIGDFVHFGDTLHGEKGVLDIDYWVLRQNVAKAKSHFPKNVKPMLRAFEHWFGPYPFYEDSYKLIDAPYLGMEHQSAIAYGNKYANGYLGTDASATGWGLKWDFIIVHESGHEWFGNNITAKDLGDMWIHEAFTNYSESLFVEWLFGKRAGQEYVYGNRRGIVNDRPLQGSYGVNKEGSGDMYLKGGVFLNQLRTIVNDDDKWRAILRGLNSEFWHQMVDYRDIERYISKKAGIDLSGVFAQYIQHSSIPILEFRVEDGLLFGRWISEVTDFQMPVRIRLKNGDYAMYQLDSNFREINLPGATKESVEVDIFNFYIGVLFN